MKTKFTYLINFSILLVLFNCGGSSSAEELSTNSTTVIPAQSSNLILKYVGKYLSDPPVFKSVNGIVTEYWNGFKHDIFYENGFINKIIHENPYGSQPTEVFFTYENNNLTKILFKEALLDGTLDYVYYFVKYDAGKIFKLIKADYYNLSDYDNDVTIDSYVYKFEYDGENISKSTTSLSTFSKSTGDTNQAVLFTEQFQYNSNVLNPHKTLPLELLIYITYFDNNYQFDILSKNVKSQKTRFVSGIPPTPIYYSYDVEPVSHYPIIRTGNALTLYYTYNSY